MTDATTIYLLLPEIVLIGAATIIYLAGAFVPRHFMPHAAAVFAILLAGLVLLGQDLHAHAELLASAPRAWISGPLAIDLLGQICLWGILLFALLLVMLSANSPSVRPAAEYVGSLLLLVAGLMIVAVAYDLVLLFVGLELISIPTYILLYLGRRDPYGQEATTKYFFLSILSSALLLYGFSFLYGAAGTTRLDGLLHVLQIAPSGAHVGPGVALAPIAVLLVFAGLGFRMTCVPLHFYAPDVYQGTSNANAGLLSTLPKIAGLLVLVRIVYASMPGLETLGWKVAMVMAVATMTLGNLVALWQSDVRRLLAYSSIAHGGYILIGVATGLGYYDIVARHQNLHLPAPEVPLQGIGASFFYLAVYCLSTIGAFAALKYLGGRDKQVDSLDELGGLGRSRPLPALALAVSMFSLAGIPPLAGFWGKLTLFSTALGVDSAPTAGDTAPLRPWFVGLAVVGVINAAIAMAYYLRVVGVMYFRSGPEGKSSPVKAEGGAGAWWAMIACTLLVLGVGVYPGPLITLTNRAAEAIRVAQPVDEDRPDMGQAVDQTHTPPPNRVSLQK
ncbi:MAG TPA: NADH-quinone oxidoreductase subunit N [Pirellulales bacterium]|nr:NADH-quinone oxidoreductase subunit N [Pirellulales bacterium]